VSPPSTTGEELCPVCGERVERAEGDFCSGCGTYVPWPRPAAAESGSRPATEAITVRQPGEAPAPPSGTAQGPLPASPEPPTRAVDIACPACATPNPPTRTLCRKCGTTLTARPPTGPAPPAAPARKLDRRKVAIGAVAVAALVAVVAFLLLREPEDVSTQVATGTTAATPGASGEPIALDSARVRVEATSTLGDEVLSDGTVLNYDAAHTLDGDPTSAWNHGAGGDGTGEALTYTFAEEVTLSHVVLVNGFALSEELFRRNGRLRDVVVTTDSGEFKLTLSDTRMPQQVEGDFGRTRSFRIGVVSVYPGESVGDRSAFGDLALSEIGFFVKPAS